MNRLSAGQMFRSKTAVPSTKPNELCKREKIRAHCTQIAYAVSWVSRARITDNVLVRCIGQYVKHNACERTWA